MSLAHIGLAAGSPSHLSVLDGASSSGSSNQRIRLAPTSKKQRGQSSPRTTPPPFGRQSPPSIHRSPRSRSLSGNSRSPTTSREDHAGSSSPVKAPLGAMLCDPVTGKGGSGPASAGRPNQVASRDQSPRNRTKRSASVPFSPSRGAKSSTPETDDLFQAARLKMSERDQEAMRKLRSTMLDDGGAGSSHSPQLSNETGESTDQAETSRLRPGVGQSKAGPSRSSPKATTAATEDDQFVIAVIGHAGAGKTSAINRALKPWGSLVGEGYRTLSGTRVDSCYSRIQPGGKLKEAWNVEFLEMDIKALRERPPDSSTSSSSSHFAWPQGLPDIHGSVLCYDATDARSLEYVPELLYYFASEHLPCVMLACKSDPECPLQVKPSDGNALGEPYNIGLIEVTTRTSEGKTKMRNAVRWLLYKLEQRQRRQDRKSKSPSPKPPDASNGRVKEARAVESDASSSADRIMKLKNAHRMRATLDDGEQNSRSSSSSLAWLAKPSGSESECPSTNKDGKHGEPPPLLTNEEDHPDPGDLGGGVRTESTDDVKPSTSDSLLFMSLDALFNRFFTALVAADDPTFRGAFLLTYRRFCLPLDLMRQFSERLGSVPQYEMTSSSRHWALQRLTGGLLDWTRQYPGDIPDPETLACFHHIIGSLLPHSFMAHLVADLVHIEASLGSVIDVDASWSLSSEPKASAASLAETSATNVQLDLNLGGAEEMYDLDLSPVKSGPDTPALSQAHTRETTPSSRTVSTTSLPMEMENLGRKSGSEPKLSLKSMEEPRAGLSFDPTAWTSNKWINVIAHVLYNDTRTFAMELTKIQWTVFSAIRTRDVLRHDLGKDKTSAAGEAIGFFNHLSRWTSSLLLSHYKPKYRAKIYERLMLITYHLRLLNNYDSMYAIIAGMRETSVLRLNQTITLVQSSVSKDFQTNLRLMDPKGGYATYRRSIQADLDKGRGAIPVLSAILGLVNRLQAMRREDIRAEDGFVQWDKFARLAEILAIIPDCQSRGPLVPGPVSPTFRRMIEEVPVIKDEDSLYMRSQTLEPTGSSGGGENVFKRLVSKRL